MPDSNQHRKTEAADRFYRRRLPHWQPPNATYFVTFRLADSLPVHVLQRLKEDRERRRQAVLRSNVSEREERKELYNLEKAYFGQFDKWLDRCVESSPSWLARPDVARIVAKAIHELSAQNYDLLAYCVMPNHVHLVLELAESSSNLESRAPFAAYPLSRVLKRIKGRTAREANQLLHRQGSFWHHGSYDHVVRDGRELERIIWYVINNPVKAGLAQDWKAWPFTYVRADLQP